MRFVHHPPPTLCKPAEQSWQLRNSEHLEQCEHCDFSYCDVCQQLVLSSYACCWEESCTFDLCTGCHMRETQVISGAGAGPTAAPPIAELAAQLRPATTLPAIPAESRPAAPPAAGHTPATVLDGKLLSAPSLAASPLAADPSLQQPAATALAANSDVPELTAQLTADPPTGQPPDVHRCRNHPDRTSAHGDGFCGHCGGHLLYGIPTCKDPKCKHLG